MLVVFEDPDDRLWLLTFLTVLQAINSRPRTGQSRICALHKRPTWVEIEHRQVRHPRSMNKMTPIFCHDLSQLETRLVESRQADKQTLGVVMPPHEELVALLGVRKSPVTRDNTDCFPAVNIRSSLLSVWRMPFQSDAVRYKP